MSIENILEQILNELKTLNKNAQKENEKSFIKEGKIFRTFKEWPQHHSWPSTSGLRWIRFHEKSLRAENCFKKCSRRVLVDEEEFLKWIESNPKYQYALKN